MKNAIILCSGGIDSVTSAHYAKKRLGYDYIIVLFFDYNQKSVRKEKECAKKCSRDVKAKFIEIKLPELEKFSTSLINVKGRVKKLKRKDLKDTRKEGMNWYVPFRNSVFLIYALVLAESMQIKQKKKYDIFVGFNRERGQGYPDTSKEFLRTISQLLRFSNMKDVKIKSPLIKKDKEDVIKIGESLDIDFRDTFSCYIGKSRHCGYCLACRLRQEGFYWANVKDPTSYKTKMRDFRMAG